ncbi:helix-turn-helix domain-containing protein, partial [Lactococcus lactis]
MKVLGCITCDLCLESEERTIELKDIRSSANVTQQFMADLLGISLVYYRKMENGDRPLSKQFEEKIRN